jgi:Mce-associated membrane protein
VEVAVPPAPDEDPGVTSSNPHEHPQSPALRLALLGVLVVALLASGGVLIWLLADRTGEADDQQAQRETVMAQTEQFLLRMGTFGPDMLDDQNEMPEYRSQVKEVITPKFETSFDKQVVAAEQLVAQGQVSREAEVFATGVSVMDDDSASALIAGSFTDSFPQGKSGEPVAGEPVPFRMEVDLVKTGGKWLVDDFTPVTGDDQ